MSAESDDHAARAAELDATDPLADLRAEFLPAPGVLAYLDGNSLGRPPAAAADRLAAFIAGPWGRQLIRGWTEEPTAGDGPGTGQAGPWMDWPTTIGDRIAALALGAAPGQTVLADSTTVLLYKLARAGLDAAMAADPARRTIVASADDFPTDRYVLEGIAAERGAQLRWLDPDPTTGVTVEQVVGAVGADTALVVLCHVGYRSGWITDAAAITEVAHAAGAAVLWDLSHSVGAVDVQLDAWGADAAVGCTYKYLCGGPGAPAFGYLRRDLADRWRQPVQGWMGHAEPFVMGPGYRPAPGVRGLVSGTPPVLAAVPLLAALDLLERAGMSAVRAKSTRLTGYALDLVDAWLIPRGAQLVSPRDPARRGGHLTVRYPGARGLVERLWARGVLPDFREPDGIRLGLAPLSTSFTEVHDGLTVLRDLLDTSRS